MHSNMAEEHPHTEMQTGQALNDVVSQQVPVSSPCKTDPGSSSQRKKRGVACASDTISQNSGKRQRASEHAEGQSATKKLLGSKLI